VIIGCRRRRRPRRRSLDVGRALVPVVEAAREVRRVAHHARRTRRRAQHLGPSKFGTALLVVEKNAHGITVLRKLRDVHAVSDSNIYHRAPLDGDRDEQHGAHRLAHERESKPILLDSGTRAAQRRARWARRRAVRVRAERCVRDSPRRQGQRSTRTAATCSSPSVSRGSAAATRSAASSWAAHERALKKHWPTIATAGAAVIGWLLITPRSPQLARPRIVWPLSLGCSAFRLPGLRNIRDIFAEGLHSLMQEQDDA
jgi:hypothetical protein